MHKQLLPALILGAASAIGFAQTPSAAAAAAPAAAPAPAPVAASSGQESGLAAVYSDRLTGHTMANGKKYNPKRLTAAHKTLAFGTKVKVTNTHNGKSVEVVITDRGPKQADRVLDITPRAAHALGISKLGMAPVTVDVVSGH